MIGLGQAKYGSTSATEGSGPRGSNVETLPNARSVRLGVTLFPSNFLTHGLKTHT